MEPIYANKAAPWSSLAILLVGSFLMILDLFIVNVALPDIQRDLHASNAQLQLVIVAYDVPFAATLLNGARLGDLFGRRRLFLWGMAIFAVASTLCAAALTPWVLIGMRAIQGVGGALMMPQAYTSVRLLFEGSNRRKAFAVMGAVQGVAGAASQVLGGYLITANFRDLGWRLVFLVNLPFALYCIAAGRWMLVETKAPVSNNIDLRGAVLAASALVIALLPIMVGREHGWPWWAFAGPLLSLPVFAYFVWCEARLSRQGGVPIIEVSLFRRTGFTLGIFTAFLFFSTISSYSLSLTLMLQIGLGRSAIEAGTIFLPSTVAFFVGSILSAHLAKWLGSSAVLVGMTIFAVGLLLSIMAGVEEDYSYHVLALSVILNGLGQGIVIPIFLNSILSTVSDEEAGMASGVYSTISPVGAAFGVALVGIIFFSVLDRGTTAGLSTGLAHSLAFEYATSYNLLAVIVSIYLLSVLKRNAEGRRPAKKKPV